MGTIRPITSDMGKPRLILFDGYCNFCSASVNFIIDHDPQRHFVFAPLQSPTGQAALKQFGLLDKGIDSVVLIDKQAYTQSTAALRIARHLRAPWHWMSLGMMFPLGLRDWVYQWIARNRYRWFGKQTTCRVPTPELRNRFVDQVG